MKAKRTRTFLGKISESKEDKDATILIISFEYYQKRNILVDYSKNLG